MHLALELATDTFLSQPWMNASASNLNLAAANQHNETGELISNVCRGVAPRGSHPALLQGPGSWGNSFPAP